MSNRLKLLEENQQRYNSLFYHNPDGVFSMDHNGNLTNINCALEKILGYSIKELSYMSYHPLIHPEYLDITNQKFLKALTGIPQNYETICIHEDGHYVPLQITNVPIIVNEDVVGVFGIAKDISKEKEAIQLLEENEEKYRSLFDNNNDAVAELDLKGNLKDGNKMVEVLLGYKKEELLGKKLFTLVTGDVEKARKDFTIAKGGKTTQAQHRIINKKGNYIDLDVITVPIIIKDEVTGIYVIARDITEIKQRQKRIKELAYTDQLTGLPNRHLLYKELQKVMAKSKERKETIAILAVDFDEFKYVNDISGHVAGDLFLQQGSNRIKNCLLKKDKIFRVGGDEFIIILENVTEVEVSRIARQIVKEMNQPFLILEHELVVTVSIGISMNSDYHINAEALIKHADMALMSAKKIGKNNFKFFTQELSEQVMRKVQIENALRKANYHSDFTLVYQPQVDIQTRQLIGLEALLRWNPNFGNVSPGEFIPIAEKTGLILPIGEWVLKETCRQIKRWEAKGLSKVRVSVNVSARQLRDPDFALKVKKIIDEENVDPRLLEIEITESVMLDVKGSSELIKEIKSLGITVAIDDFGVGFSSINLISNLDFHTLKIDKSLIDDVKNERKLSILKAIIGMQKALGSQIIIEGIETNEQVNCLKDYPVIAQGYYFCRPLPPEQLEKVWNKNWE